VSDGAATGRLTVRRLLNPLWSVNIRAEWGQRVQVCCRMIADEVDGPRTDEHERSYHGDDGGVDHDVAPFISSGLSPGATIKQTPLPTMTFRIMGLAYSSGASSIYAVPFEDQSGGSQPREKHRHC